MAMLDRAHSYEVRRGDHAVSCDPAWLDLDYLFDFLSTAYWHTGLARDRLERSVAYSINSGSMIWRTTFAYLADVFIDSRFRGNGLGHWLMVAVHGHPELQGLRRWTLKTRDAHRLYEQFGYEMVGAEAGLTVRTP